MTSLKILTPIQCKELKDQISTCLRLQEDFSIFHREARRYSHFRWISRMKTGRLLRAPTVFEDIIKIICTTNCSWALTEIMVENLCRELGKPFNADNYNFPTPESLAGVSEQFLRSKIRSGYRSPYLLEFAEKVAHGKFNVEQWRTSELPTHELFSLLRSIKGIGNYAAGNILKLLGRYDYLGLDSWVRKQYYTAHHKGRTVTDRTIERHFARYGTWRGLFFWLQMTKHWYYHKFPF